VNKFRRRPESIGGINITDNILIIEGGVPLGWNYETGEAITPMAVTPKDAFSTPTSAPPPPPTAPTVRKFRPKPRITAGDDEGVPLIFKIVGGLPDWRHSAENKAKAMAEYEVIKQQEAAGQVLADAFEVSQPDVSQIHVSQPDVTGDDHEQQ
jgi:hypothetical protein